MPPKSFTHMSSGPNATKTHLQNLPWSELTLLPTCPHAGLVDKGLEYFASMETVHGLTPEMKHYGCVVDLLSRSGYLERAYQFIKNMPIHPDVVVWRILLSACKLHGNVVLAEIVTNNLLELDPSNSGNFVLLSNTYGSSDRWDAATKMRELEGTMCRSQLVGAPLK